MVQVKCKLQEVVCEIRTRENSLGSCQALHFIPGTVAETNRTMYISLSEKSQKKVGEGSGGKREGSRVVREASRSCGYFDFFRVF